MRKIITIKKHRDKITLVNDGKELCNIVVSNSSTNIQAHLSIETDDPDLIITREEV